MEAFFSPQLNLAYRLSISNSDHIITVSNFASEILRRTFKISKDKISTIYEGVELKDFQESFDNCKLTELRPYILFVSTLYEFKNLEVLIVEAQGSTDRFKIRQLLDRMHSSDIATIREWLADNSPGIETRIDIGCAQCGNEFKVMLPITESFFRPQSPRGV